MVLIALLAIGAGAIAFFSLGGIKSIRAFAESEETITDKQNGKLVVPIAQSGKGTIPIASGSRMTVSTVKREDILRIPVATKRKFAPSADLIPIKTFFDNPKEGGVLASQVGQVVGANLSISKSTQFGQGQFGLTAQEVTTIRRQEFTDQELQDIDALTARFQRKTVSAQAVSDTPEEIIQIKREQEAIARKVLESQVGAGSFTLVGGAVAEKAGLVDTTQFKLFAKPNFIFGGVTEEVFVQQQQELQEKFARIAVAEQEMKTREVVGQQILSTISQAGQSQTDFLLSQGIGLRGGDLSAQALARLRERGLI